MKEFVSPCNILSSNFINEPFFLKPKKLYDETMVFEDTWVTQFPWVQSIQGDDDLECQR